MWLFMPVPIFVAVAAVLVGVLVAGRRLVPGTFTVKRAFLCPFRDRNVSVDFTEAVWDGGFVDVIACTEFWPPGDVRCDKSCLTLGKFPAPRELTTT